MLREIVVVHKENVVLWVSQKMPLTLVSRGPGEPRTAGSLGPRSFEQQDSESSNGRPRKIGAPGSGPSTRIQEFGGDPISPRIQVTTERIVDFPWGK